METTKKQINEYSKIFTHILKGSIASICEKYKTEKAVVVALNKKDAENRIAHNSPIPQIIEIEMTWRKSCYGYCPRADMRYYDTNGWHYLENCAYAGGCGYDKTSTILANCLNLFPSLKWAFRNKRKKMPYGMAKTTYNDGVYFEYGVGESCYYRVAEYMGYAMKHTASGKTYDKFVFVKKGVKY